MFHAGTCSVGHELLINVQNQSICHETIEDSIKYGLSHTDSKMPRSKTAKTTKKKSKGDGNLA